MDNQKISTMRWDVHMSGLLLEKSIVSLQLLAHAKPWQIGAPNLSKSCFSWGFPRRARGIVVAEGQRPAMPRRFLASHITLRWNYNSTYLNPWQRESQWWRVPWILVLLTKWRSRDISCPKAITGPSMIYAPAILQSHLIHLRRYSRGSSAQKRTDSTGRCRWADRPFEIPWLSSFEMGI